MQKVLLIEDDKTFTKIVEGFLSKSGYQVVSCLTAGEGLKAAKDKSFNIVLLDYRLPDMNGMEVLVGLKKLRPELPVIIMTGFSDVRTAVKAVKSGAYEYITKPVNPDELLFLIKEATASVHGKSPVERKSKKQFVEGHSAASRKLQEYIRLVAPTDFTVIIEGESGTGKENVARTIHQLSSRAQRPFIAVDCGVLSNELASSELFGHVKGSFTGAINDKMGQIEAADGGTLFLDEVGNLSYDVQVKLLRSIQERLVTPLGSNKEIKVDVRIITATNDDLMDKAKNGLFREDLYHRLNEFKFNVPAVRERGADLAEFMDCFKAEASEELGKPSMQFSDSVKEIFRRYAWPGNLRELRNVIRRAVLLTTGDEIDVTVLPEEMVVYSKSESSPATKPDNQFDLKALTEMQERDVIMRTLQHMKYNKSKAAKALNIDRKTLYLKMEKYGIE